MEETMSKDGEKEFNKDNPQQLSPGNDATMPESVKEKENGIKPRSANILLYCIVVGSSGLVAGIVLFAYGKLSPQIAQIAGGLGTLMALVSGMFGSTIQ